MSYSDFTLESLRSQFGVQVRDEALFPEVGTVEPTTWLRQALAFGASLAFASEKARSEFIVAPVLVTCRELLNHRFQVHSGVRLDVLPESGLTGECDFILDRSRTVLALEAPLMLIVEAKKNDIEVGVGQCGAQMQGATIYNAREGKPVPFVYGCVTTGESWQFLKLQEQTLTIHPERYPIQELGKVIWFLVQCLRDVDRVATATAA